MHGGKTLDTSSIWRQASCGARSTHMTEHIRSLPGQSAQPRNIRIQDAHHEQTGHRHLFIALLDIHLFRQASREKGWSVIEGLLINERARRGTH